MILVVPRNKLSLPQYYTLKEIGLRADNIHDYMWAKKSADLGAITQKNLYKMLNYFILLVPLIKLKQREKVSWVASACYPYIHNRGTYRFDTGTGTNLSVKNVNEII